MIARQLIRADLEPCMTMFGGFLKCRNNMEQFQEAWSRLSTDLGLDVGQQVPEGPKDYQSLDDRIEAFLSLGSAAMQSLASSVHPSDQASASLLSPMLVEADTFLHRYCDASTASQNEQPLFFLAQRYLSEHDSSALTYRLNQHSDRVLNFVGKDWDRRSAADKKAVVSDLSRLATLRPGTTSMTAAEHTSDAIVIKSLLEEVDPYLLPEQYTDSDSDED